ncbi:unnamed protein product [Lactuca virosa]|uniref:Glycosyl transferase 48 domain-containing protein n=1 Tax=Lactuca virosa TaxID=75947 RepID=A0AAU9NLF1_9ASTR|nr:unnamed protein product [Lactuca virosa]
MRNLQQEFHAYHGIILGVREHVFTESVSSLASFLSNHETTFVTLGQRVLASPLKVRMHDGYPDAFDRVVHITQGGISKDIYAGCKGTRCWAESDCSAFNLELIAKFLNNTALNTALITQFLFQICVFTVLPMVLGFILELAFLRIYLLDIHIFYINIFFVVGFLLGARDCLGEIRSLSSVHKNIERNSLKVINQVLVKEKFDAARY